MGEEEKKINERRTKKKVTMSVTTATVGQSAATVVTVAEATAAPNKNACKITPLSIHSWITRMAVRPRRFPPYEHNASPEA